MPTGWQRWILAAIHLTLAVLLFYAAGKRSYNYYVLVRFAVCAGSVYLAFRWWRSAWFVALLFLGVAVLFNPVAPFRFQKETWSTIDLITSAAFGLTAIVYGSLATGLFLLTAAIWIISAFGEKAVIAIALSRAGQEAEGVILTVDESVEDCEGCAGGIMRIFDATYEFRLPDGRMVTGSADFRSEPGDKVKVFYNVNNPKESRIATDGRSGIGGTIFEFLCMGAIAALLGWWGTTKIWDEWKEFKTGKRTETLA
jgi:hypothetical protein